MSKRERRDLDYYGKRGESEKKRVSTTSLFFVRGRKRQRNSTKHDGRGVTGRESLGMEE